MFPTQHDFLLQVCMDRKALSLHDCMKVFLHGAWHRFTMARLHVVCILGFKNLSVVLQ